MIDTKKLLNLLRIATNQHGSLTSDDYMELVKMDLIVRHGSGNCLSGKGNKFVEMICATPFPETENMNAKPIIIIKTDDGETYCQFEMNERNHSGLVLSGEIVLSRKILRNMTKGMSYDFTVKLDFDPVAGAAKLAPRRWWHKR